VLRIEPQEGGAVDVDPVRWSGKPSEIYLSVEDGPDASAGVFLTAEHARTLARELLRLAEMFESQGQGG
jgi:hypothetical protein